MRFAFAISTAMCLAACGGGGGDAVAPANPATPVPVTTPTAPAVTAYPNSVVLGLAGTRSVSYTDAAAGASPTITTTEVSALLKAGVNTVIAEHKDATQPGFDVVCISGDGTSTNVITQINRGVIAESAAVLFSASWTAVDATAAWARAASAGAKLSGWENCGVKPEGLPSRSSLLTASADGSYVEDVYDGNPGTTFLSIRRIVTAADVTAMLSEAGQSNVDVATRPMVLKLRAYSDGAGHTVFIQTGLPTAAAPATARGFIALYQSG